MSHGSLNGVVADPGVDVKVVPQVKNVGHGTGAGNGEVAPSAQVQSFEGPEKVLEVWFKQPLKSVKSGLSLSKECEEQATNSSGAGACKTKAIVCPGSNGRQGSSENGNDANGDGASSHNVPEGVPDGKSFGKPDGLPVPMNGGPQGTPDGRCGKPDGLGGAQQVNDNGSCKCNVSSSSKLEEKGLDGSTIKREGLRTVPRKEWEVLLDLVHCQILSITSNAYMDAFVLSESSLFVYPHRIVLKTCGTTTLLKCVQKLLEVGKSVGLTEVEDVFYCRKNFLYPENQLFPHSSFKDECDFLDQHFQGSGYQLGKTNGDHWFLYVTDQSASVETTGQPDQTLEILMSGLDPEHMKQLFYKNKDFVSAKETTKKSGIGDLFPGAIIDDYMFDPCGYSMNGLIGDSYFTIHVTPQPQCSYASFETNASYKDYTELIKKVVNVFKPANFFVTLFANIYTAPALDSSFPTEISGCKKAAKMLCEFNNSYRLSFAQYVADPKTRPLSKSPVRTPRPSPNDS